MVCTSLHANIPQQVELTKQILSKAATELPYIERSVLMKEVNEQNFWNFELGSQEAMSDPIWKIAGFQKNAKTELRKSEQGYLWHTTC